MRKESPADARSNQKPIPKIATHHHYHRLVFLSFIWSRDPQAPSSSSHWVATFFLCSHSCPPPTFLLNIWEWKVGRRSQELGGLLLRGMPSANQLAGGKEGLNEANDPTAITAERSALNIGIPVWNEGKGLGSWGGGGGQLQPGPDVSSCQTTGAAAAVIV